MGTFDIHRTFRRPHTSPVSPPTRPDPTGAYPRSAMDRLHHAQLEEIAQWLRDARRVVALTGAGISTESGIPDFRGPNGLWTKDPAAEKTANIEYYVSDPAVRARSWQNRLR